MFAGGTPGLALIEGGWKLAIAEDDRRLVVVIAHLGIAGGREGDDTEFARRQSLRGSKRTGCRFAGDRSIGLEVSTSAVVRGMSSDSRLSYCQQDLAPSLRELSFVD
jgi:hypothetical protein